MITALATADQRAGLVAAIFMAGYLAFSLPALIAGVATTHFGLHATALIYSASLVGLGIAAACILLLHPAATAIKPASSRRAVIPGPCTVPPCPQAIDPTDVRGAA